MPLNAAMDEIRTIAPASLSRGSAFWTVARVSGEGLVEILFGRVDQRLGGDETRVGDHDIDAPFLFPNSCKESIEIKNVLNVALDSRHALSNQGRRHVELVLATAK